MRMLDYDVVIIGGVAAGTSAGAAMKRLDPSLNVLLIQKERYISYGGCGIPYYIAGIVERAEDLVHFTPQQFREKRGVHVMEQSEVYTVDFEKKKVGVILPNRVERFSIGWKKLVIATGASPIVPKIEGIEDKRIKTLRTLEDAYRLRRFIENEKPESVAIVGGGYVGLEMAEAFSMRGMKVHIIEMLDRLAGSEEEMNEVIVEELRSKGVEVHLETKVEKFIPEEEIEVVTDKGSLKVDFVLMAVGVKPNTELFDVEKGIKGAIKVDNFGRTSVEDVYAAGDCATVRHVVTGEDVYIPMGTTANKQGRVVGRVIGGGRDEFKGVVGSAITKIFDLEFGKTGLTLDQAKEKFDADAVYIKSKSRAGYYPGSSDVHLKLVFEKGTGRILGAQIAGKEIHKRLNVLSTAIHAGMSIFELSYLDLAYAPPFSPVWDPVLIAAHVARKRV